MYLVLQDFLDAARDGHEGALEWCLKSGVNINHQDKVSWVKTWKSHFANPAKKDDVLLFKL